VSIVPGLGVFALTLARSIAPEGQQQLELWFGHSVPSGVAWGSLRITIIP
jgi:hypothetical protein